MFKFGPIHFNLYGLMFALGTLVASLLATREAKKRNINPEIIWDLALYLILGVIIGARLFYILFYWPQTIPFTLFEMIAVWKGGLSFFGGLTGAIIAGHIYIKKHKLKFWVFADIFTIPLIVGHIFGRLGDYFTGGHPGKITDLPWAIYLNDALRHPVVLYEILGLITIIIILLNLKKIKSFDGFLFSSYLILYSIQRMILDFFRIQSTDPRYWGLTPTQYMAIIIFIFAGYFTIHKFNNLKFKPHKQINKQINKRSEAV